MSVALLRGQVGLLTSHTIPTSVHSKQPYCPHRERKRKFDVAHTQTTWRYGRFLPTYSGLCVDFVLRLLGANDKRWALNKQKLVAKKKSMMDFVQAQAVLFKNMFPCASKARRGWWRWKNRCAASICFNLKPGYLIKCKIIALSMLFAKNGIAGASERCRSNIIT